MNLTNNQLKEFNYMWNFGSLAGITPVIMIVTGIVPSMHYTAHVDYAFDSVERIMRDVNPWMVDTLYTHERSKFFSIVTYIHILQRIYYGSYKASLRTVMDTWCINTTADDGNCIYGICFILGTNEFLGCDSYYNRLVLYLLVGEQFVTWLWGGFSVDQALLNRFFSLHFVLPICNSRCCYITSRGTT